MLNLFRAEYYKLWKNKSFYICALIGAGLSLLLYGTLFLVDSLEKAEPQQGQGGITITAQMQEDTASPEGTDKTAETGNPQETGSSAETMPMSQRIGIMGVIEQMMSGSFASFIASIFVCIFVIGEYGNGAIKNVVGKGHSRNAVFLTKLLAAELAALLINLIIVGACLLFGAILLGKGGIQSIHWADLAAFTGIQLAFSAALVSIVTWIGELTRSLAAGISLSIALVMFSTSLTAGLDLVFHNLNWKPSSYWLMDLQTTPLADVCQGDFIIRAAVISLAWFLAAAMAGTLHFQKSDIK